MSDWLDTFEFAGVPLNEGEKSLMRFAISKDQNRIINKLTQMSCTCLAVASEEQFYQVYGEVQAEHTNCDHEISISEVIALIKGEQE